MQYYALLKQNKKKVSSDFSPKLIMIILLNEEIKISRNIVSVFVSEQNASFETKISILHIALLVRAEKYFQNYTEIYLTFKKIK